MLIIGLGNIGREYENTRHNIGFTIVDYILKHYQVSWNKKTKLPAEIAQLVDNGNKLLLAKPTSYVNLAGKAVHAICSYYNIKPQDIFVFHDDIDLEVGRIKYKFSGGSGGHNGLRSLDQSIGKDYHRIRIGVGRPSCSIDISDYVLATFPKEESLIINSSIEVIITNFNLLVSNKLDEFKIAINQSMTLSK